MSFKARLCVRGDLQEKNTLAGTYAATLAARSFRTAMALMARFDLEYKQFDVKNTFFNAKRDENGVLVICQLSDGFKKEGYYLELERALYGLRDSPLL